MTHTEQSKLVRLAVDTEAQHEVYGRREPKPDKTQGVVAYLEVDGVYLRGDQFLEEIRKVVADVIGDTIGIALRNQLEEIRARRAAAAE